jgi:hypothetical protein
MPCSIGVLERQDAALRLRLVADVRVLLAHATITPVWRGRANNRREHRTRCIIAGEAFDIDERRKSRKKKNEFF